MTRVTQSLEKSREFRIMEGKTCKRGMGRDETSDQEVKSLEAFKILQESGLCQRNVGTHDSVYGRVHMV